MIVLKASYDNSIRKRSCFNNSQGTLVLIFKPVLVTYLRYQKFKQIACALLLTIVIVVNERHHIEGFQSDPSSYPTNFFIPIEKTTGSSLMRHNCDVQSWQMKEDRAIYAQQSLFWRVHGCRNSFKHVGHVSEPNSTGCEI